MSRAVLAIPTGRPRVGLPAWFGVCAEGFVSRAVGRCGVELPGWLGACAGAGS